MDQKEHDTASKHPRDRNVGGPERKPADKEQVKGHEKERKAPDPGRRPPDKTDLGR